jgi:hypothetical protein
MRTQLAQLPHRNCFRIPNSGTRVYCILYLKIKRKHNLSPFAPKHILLEHSVCNPRSLYCWKAEDLSFPHVSLVLGVNFLGILLNKHSLRVGWRNFFPYVLLCQFLVLVGNRFWLLHTYVLRVQYSCGVVLVFFLVVNSFWCYVRTLWTIQLCDCGCVSFLVVGGNSSHKT